MERSTRGSDSLVHSSEEKEETGQVVITVRYKEACDAIAIFEPEEAVRFIKHIIDVGDKIEHLSTSQRV
jgi:O-methyltransferase involved in polyketide biosynthesis